MHRREFIATTALGVSSLGFAGLAQAEKTGTDSETLVATFYGTLSPEQKKAIVFPFDHPLRSKVDNSWMVTPQKIADYYTPDQKAMIEEIFRGLHNPDFVEKVMKHLKDDAGGLGAYSVALFGAPGIGKFEFVLAGRHCTVRCDGDSVDGVAFGGPIFYGHSAGTDKEAADHPGNVYWYQAKRANEVFQALDGKQRQVALLGDPREEQSTATVDLKKPGERLAGLPVSDMSRDQRVLVEKVLADLLLPFRKRDVDEAMRMIKANGGVNSLAMSFYKNLDVGNDGVWDVWQLESPKMVWYFRGSPHVHTWVNIKS